MIHIPLRLTGTLLVASSLMLAGCTTTGPKQDAGAVIGGLGGAALGAAVGNAVGGRDGAVIGAAFGGLGGALIGSEIGRQMDERDRAMRDAALEAAYAEQARRRSANIRRSWSNPQTGNRGEVVGLRTFVQDGKTCSVFKEVYHKRDGDRSFAEEHTRCVDENGFYR